MRELPALPREDGTGNELAEVNDEHDPNDPGEAGRFGAHLFSCLFNQCFSISLECSKTFILHDILRIITTYNDWQVSRLCQEHVDGEAYLNEGGTHENWSLSELAEQVELNLRLNSLTYDLSGRHNAHKHLGILLNLLIRQLQVDVGLTHPNIMQRHPLFRVGLAESVGHILEQTEVALELLDGVIEDFQVFELVQNIIKSRVLIRRLFGFHDFHLEWLNIWLNS